MIRTWTSENAACSNISVYGSTGFLPEASSTIEVSGEGHDEREDRAGHREEQPLLVELLHQRPRLPGRPGFVGRLRARGLFVFQVAGGGAGHGRAQLLGGDGGRVGVGDQPAVVDHPEGVGQADQLVQVGGDQQHGQALAAGLADLVPDLGLRADVHTAGGVGGDQEARLVAHLAADDQLLLVAAGEGGGGDVDAGGADVVLARRSGGCPPGRPSGRARRPWRWAAR